MTEAPAMAVIEAPPCTIGEGPLWSPDEGALYWIDTVGKRILRARAPFRTAEERGLPFKPSALALTDAGDLLVAYKKGIGLFDFDSGASVQLPLDGLDFTDEIFNDGACDAQGRFWIGTRDRQVKAPVGSLYVIGPDLQARQMRAGVVCSNGIAWSPDGSTLYHTDSHPGAIAAYAFEPGEGALRDGRTFLDYAGQGYHPDGCTVDAEGFLWVAEVQGGRISRYAPDGRCERSIALPVSKPTSVMFGGADLKTLFVTSMRYGLSDEQLHAQPHAGKILCLPMAVPGLPEARFRARGSVRVERARAELAAKTGA